MDCRQLREYIVTPALAALGMYSTNAANLVIGTCAQETQLGHYIVQEGIGMKGGIGIYQMEKPAYNQIWDKQISPNNALRSRIKLLLGYQDRPPAERMATDLLLATAICRLYYYAVPKELPKADDLPAMAAFYKKFYNTLLGSATEQQFIDNYKRYVR